MTEARPYRSPLRQEQARQTRALVLDTLIDLVSEQGPAELSIRDLAARAGVSERTVYRHFPDRAALLDGLAEHVSGIVEWPAAREVVERLEDVPSVIPEMFARYDAHERVMRAAVLLNLDPARTMSVSRENQAVIREKLGAAYPELGDDLELAAAVLHLLASSRTWLRFRDQDGLTGEQVGRAAAWAVRLVLDDLAANRSITAPTG